MRCAQNKVLRVYESGPCQSFVALLITAVRLPVEKETIIRDGISRRKGAEESDLGSKKKM